MRGTRLGMGKHILIELYAYLSCLLHYVCCTLYVSSHWSTRGKTCCEPSLNQIDWDERCRYPKFYPFPIDSRGLRRLDCLFVVTNSPTIWFPRTCLQIDLGNL
ncbi:hypothetical protein F5Y17DRAFT_429646 [Xylariaceae sp. FL0594]|nr:hypothetical protein F5Y17DRAFT_429646 [Xylariaceae sp. FL0594]